MKLIFKEKKINKKCQSRAVTYINVNLVQNFKKFFKTYLISIIYLLKRIGARNYGPGSMPDAFTYYALQRPCMSLTHYEVKHSALGDSCVTAEKAIILEPEDPDSNNDSMWSISFVTLDKSLFNFLHQPQG